MVSSDERISKEYKILHVVYLLMLKAKLLFLVSEDWFFCSHFLARAQAIRNAGYEVIVLTQVNQHRDTIENAGLRLIPLKIDRRSINPLSALLTLLQIIRIYRLEKPIIVHQVALKPILLGGIAARFVGVPYVVNAVVGGGYAFTSKNLLMRVLRPSLQLALRILLNPKGSRVIFENADDLATFVQLKQVRKKDSALIRGAGVEPELYRPGKVSLDPPVIVLVARLLWDKGIGEFVKAARILHQRGILARFVVVGGTDEGNRACIDKKTLGHWQKEGVVEFWGFRADIPEVLAQASIACLPSYREGLPKSLLEAMAASLPCIATDVPGCREAVQDSKNGLLVPARDSTALAIALEKLIKDPILRKKMGQHGRKRLEEEFSIHLITQQTLAIYEELLPQ